jgi:hypothetical protein
MGIDVDSLGRVWAFSRVPSADWRKAWGPAITGISEVAVTSELFSKLYDTMIEVIDVRRRVVIAQQRLPRTVISVLPGLRMVSIQRVRE